MRKTVREILMTSDDREIPAWIIEATDAELDDFIFCTSSIPARHNVGLAERSKRQFNQLKKPHWSLTWGFIVAFLAMVFAAIAAWPVIREWIQCAPPTNKGANSPQLQSNSVPVMPVKTQTSPPSIYAAPNTNLLKK